MVQEECSNQSILLHLPSEILELIIHMASRIPRNTQNQIISWQYPEHAYTHLQNMALTCRKLYTLCAPYLWRDKEFILPAEDHEPPENTTIRMATDILSEKTIVLKQQMQHHLGGYVRSLCRDLTNNPHYDLSNSLLMAHLVHNLKALRIDFHPKPRSEPYGLCYFVEHCTSLTELYLENCRDTFDDFYSLVKYQRPLQSLTLVSCTVKADTLVQLSKLCNSTIKSLILQHIWLEPTESEESYTSSINNLTTSYLHSKQVTLLSPQLYTQVLSSNYYLTLLVLSDSISLETLHTISHGSPYLERMTISLHERYPPRVVNCLLLISNLKHLTLLSLAFRFINNLEMERLPCCAPSHYWTFLLDQLHRLQFIHVSATQLLLNNDFMNRLVSSSTSPSNVPKNVMLHHVAMMPTTTVSALTMNILKGWKKNQQFILADYHMLDIVNEYETNHLMAQNNIQSWHSSCIWDNIKDYILSLEQAERKGYNCFDHLDKVCFIKGFDDWVK
ncbi:hypothetical protein BJ944DRAFT_175141 [Cunninghamella echinulata]|nr:hypothetical protein BJ944DRAFT_175141 [Cunninghamella echinulata]